MYLKRDIWAGRLYLILAGIFIASLVTCNLIFQKFFSWTPLSFLLKGSSFINIFFPESLINMLGNYTFQISVGILPYPVTFLITDIISEIYGRKKANQVVVTGFVASIFIMGVTMLADTVTATSWSPVSDQEFHKVFGLFGPAVFASMTAYLAAQFIDIRIFHFWKNLTKGKHLWLRNNGSTIFSQLVDTASVLILLCSFGAIGWERFTSLFINGFLFKILIAFLDTPLFYFFTWYLRKSFKLDLNQSLSDHH